MEFFVFSNSKFKAGIDYHQRSVKVQELRSGDLRLIDVLSGAVLYESLDPASITVDGQPMQSAEQLQSVVFSRSCVCDTDDDLPEPFKYHDMSFDNTFE